MSAGKGKPNMQKFCCHGRCVHRIIRSYVGGRRSEVGGQSNNEPAVAPAPRTVNLTTEQRFIIKEIVLKVT